MVNVLAKLLEFLLSLITRKYRLKKDSELEFNSLKRHILNVALTSDYPVEMLKMRNFLLDSGLVDMPRIKIFFDKWLNHPVVTRGQPASGFMDNIEKIEELKKELMGLKI